MIPIAIAVNGGHISRAIDFYKAEGKYFVVGGTTPWTDETSPPAPAVTDFTLRDIVGLKKVDNTHLVIPHASGTIQYRDQNWKIVSETVSTTTNAEVAAGERVIPVASLVGLSEGSKVRVNNLYEGTITAISGLNITLNTAAPSKIPSGSAVVGGALVEGAKYVYVDCYLNYDEFPLVTYRQLGLCTGVGPNTIDVLKSANYSVGNTNEYTSIGTLEILDNRAPTTRDASQRELLSLIIEF